MRIRKRNRAGENQSGSAALASSATVVLLWAFLRNFRYLFFVAALVPLFFGIYFFCYWMRFDGRLTSKDFHGIQATVGWIVCVKLVWFVGLRTCRGWSRLVTFTDLMSLLKTTLAGSVSIVSIHYLLVPSPAIPRSILLMDWGTTVVVLGGLRSFSRVWCDIRALFTRPARQIRVLVAGVGETGKSILRTIRLENGSMYRIVGFITDDIKSVGLHIDGILIVGTLDQTPQLAARYRIGQVFVVQGDFPGVDLKKLMHNAERHRFTVRVIPNYRHLIEGSMTVQPRPVSIEDLLQREPVHIDTDNIKQWLAGQTVLVTGSAGSIGSEICRQLLRLSPQHIVAVDRSENGQFFLEHQLHSLVPNLPVSFLIADVLDENSMRRILQRHRPQVIFHAAAYKHVPLMEQHPDEAVRNIVTATRRLADLAEESRVDSFVLISTDKAVNPTSVMGACKRTAELYLQSLQGRTSCRFVTVRFGNVIDSAGSVVQVFRRQIASGGPVTVTHPDIRRFFMTIPEAARLVIQAGALGEAGQIMFLDMGEPVRIADLAAEMIRLSGLRLKTDIEIEFTGLRPGEKMYEELHLDHEERLPTRHPKIFHLPYHSSPCKELLRSIHELERLAHDSPQRVFAQLQAIVPEYRRSAIPNMRILLESAEKECRLKAS